MLFLLVIFKAALCNFFLRAYEQTKTQLLIQEIVVCKAICLHFVFVIIRAKQACNYKLQAAMNRPSVGLWQTAYHVPPAVHGAENDVLQILYCFLSPLGGAIHPHHQCFFYFSLSFHWLLQAATRPIGGGGSDLLLEQSPPLQAGSAHLGPIGGL